MRMVGCLATRGPRLRIGIDGKVLTSQASGIGRYAVNVVRSLLMLSATGVQHLEFVIFTGPQTSRDLLAGYQGTYHQHCCVAKSSLLRSLVSIPAGIVSQGIEVFHGLDHVGLPLFFKRGKYIVTLHDVIPLTLPHLFPLKHRLVVTAALSRVSKQADVVIVPSQAVQEEVLQLLPVSKDRLVVIPEGCEVRFAPLDDPGRLARVQRKYGLPASYMLFLGTLEPRKNVETLLQAFARFQHSRPASPSVHLVVAGARGWRYQTIFHTIRSLGLEQHVHFPGFIDDNDLPDLYRGAELFVFPSLSEGFGLPILEAMGCGVPVITAKTAALPEVAGDAAMLVDPRDPEALAAAMHEVLHNGTLREHLRRTGLERARHFSWEITARKILDLYMSVGG
jgi:glycosyltransferase involved in cell wall biosynthesis